MFTNVCLPAKTIRVQALCRRLPSIQPQKDGQTVNTGQVCWRSCNAGSSSGGSGSGSRCPDLSLKTMNQRIVLLQYAVRGPLLMRAEAIQNEIKSGTSKMPFKRVIHANLGDAHAMGQKPITFVRQVMAGMTDPELLLSGYPEDVKERVKTLLPACRGSIGSYSASNGIEIIRKNVAKFIQCRDDFPCDWNNVVLTAGASTGIKYVLSLFKNNPSGKPSGIMIPIPQYPLYTASIAEYSLHPVSYYLDEEHGWGTDPNELERAYEEGSKKSEVRAIVIINPGNPTGQVLSKKNIEDVFKFANKHNLFIFADEVYQDNVYAKGSQFWSFKKIQQSMGEPYSKMPMGSFMSMSKGFLGECGLRAGYMELVNLDKDVQAHLYKMISSNLCCSVIGQVAVDCYVKPPSKGDPSYDLYCKEKSAVLSHLAERAKLVYDSFSKMEGFHINVVQGAMYAFPRFEMPQKAIDAAKKEGKPPDVFYAFKLLENTGICVVPGSGFGQRKGTHHFRTTILPQTKLLMEMLQIFQQFHENFTKEYS